MSVEDQKGKTAELIKKARLSKGYTQGELAGFAGISLRSVQRIENGEVIPRVYTLKILEKCLDLNLDYVTNISEPVAVKVNLPRKVILTVAVISATIFIMGAFISQSPRFPETNFEEFSFLAFYTTALGIFLYKVWK